MLVKLQQQVGRALAGGEAAEPQDLVDVPGLGRMSGLTPGTGEAAGPCPG